MNFCHNSAFSVLRRVLCIFLDFFGIFSPFSSVAAPVSAFGTTFEEASAKSPPYSDLVYHLSEYQGELPFTKPFFERVVFFPPFSPPAKPSPKVANPIFHHAFSAYRRVIFKVYPFGMPHSPTHPTFLSLGYSPSRKRSQLFDIDGKTNYQRSTKIEWQRTYQRYEERSSSYPFCVRPQ